MANVRRSRENFIGGTITDNPLEFDASTFNSAELIALSEIDASEHAVVIMDPLGEADGPETIYIVGHEAGATVADILRGLEGTTGVEHPVGTKWAVSPTAYDFIGVYATAGDLPEDPFVGQHVYVLDNPRVLVWNGVAWNPPWNLAWGRLSSNKENVDSTLAAGLGAETVVLTTAGVSIPAGRRILVTFRCAAFATTGSEGYASIRRGTTTGGTLIVDGPVTVPVNKRDSFVIAGEDTGASGTTTYVLTLQPTGGQPAIDARTPWFYMVEDVGPAANPS